MFGKIAARWITHETDDLALRKRLIQAWDDGNGTLRHYPKRSDWSVEISNHGPSIAAGGGLDVVITRPFAWRLINIEYNHTWMSDGAMIHPPSRFNRRRPPDRHLVVLAFLYLAWKSKIFPSLHHICNESSLLVSIRAYLKGLPDSS